VGGESGENPRPAAARSSLHRSDPTEATELTQGGRACFGVANGGNRTDMADAGQPNPIKTSKLKRSFNEALLKSRARLKAALAERSKRR
jgi:hypothetical protein